jgi:glycosyltransferase involved in cell wall biosynthesis
MRRLPFDRVLFSDRNRGLGYNTNSGLAAAKGDFVLQLQDDWKCLGPSDFLASAISLLQARPDVGLVRFTAAALPEADEVVTLECGRRARIYRPLSGSGRFLYSDHPHLKSRAFVEFIGPYRESRYMQRTEVDMRDRFNAQNRYAAAFLEGDDVFEHIGAGVSLRQPTPLARSANILSAVPLLGHAVRALRRRRRALCSDEAISAARTA